MPPAASMAPVRICDPIGDGRTNETSFMSDVYAMTG